MRHGPASQNALDVFSAGSPDYARDGLGAYFLTLGASEREAVDAEVLVSKVSAFVRQNPEVPVLIGGDERVDYGSIYAVMVLLQQAGAPKVGLMSQPSPPPGKR